MISHIARPLALYLPDWRAAARSAAHSAGFAATTRAVLRYDAKKMLPEFA